MSQLDEVESLLEQLSGEGQLASRGQFTLDPGKSRQKIGQYLESDRASWANWWVRAMFALGCTGLHLQLGRRTLLVTASFPVSSSGLEGLSAFLARGHDPSNSQGLALLRNGLLWLQAWMDLEAGLKVSLLLQDCGRDCGFWRLSETGLEAGPSPQGSAQPELKLTLQSPNLAAVRALLACALPQRLAFATAPVSLDGRRLNPEGPTGDLLFARYYLGAGSHLVVPAPETLPAHHYAIGGQLFDRPRLATPPARVSHFSLAGRLPPQLRWSATSGQALLSFQHGRESHRLYIEGADPFPVAENWPPGAGQPWKVAVAFFRSFEGPDQVIIVDHGLCLEPSPLRLFPGSNLGWKVLVARDGIPTDLSGIKPVLDPAYQKMLAWVTGELGVIHQQLR